MSWALTSSMAIIAKAGIDANVSSALLVKYSDQAEGYICAATLTDWVSKIATISANFKPILDDCASSLAAMMVINYDMSGFPSVTQAQTMLDVLKDDSDRCIKVLSDAKTKVVMGAG